MQDVCVRCREIKDRSEFHGNSYICERCHTSNRENESYKRIEKTYGLTKEDYEELLHRQKGSCAICREEPSGGIGGKLCVDHDHRTGEVRGLLCNKCNLAIGYLNDDYDNAIVLAFYLMSNAIKSHRTITRHEFAHHAMGYLRLFHLPSFTDEDMQRLAREHELMPRPGDAVTFVFGTYTAHGIIIENLGPVGRSDEEMVRVRFDSSSDAVPLEIDIPTRLATIVSNNRTP